MKKLTSLFLFCLLFTGCTAQLSDYEQSTPSFDMQDFFNGKLKAFGMVQDRSGKVIRRFEADLNGSWQGNQGILDEDFYYDDGETQKRLWRITKHPDGHYTGTAGDVIGTASGRATGFAFNWHYTLDIIVNGRSWHVNLNDWLYQLDNKRLINRTEMKKWGVKVGDITLVIEKLDGHQQ